MRAVVQDRYGDPGDVLRIDDRPVPVPSRGQVLVRVAASAVHSDIWHAVTGQPYVARLLGGPRRPRPVPGVEVSGTVEGVGPDVRRFGPGDEVFGLTLETNWWRNGGALAEFCVADEKLLRPKPTRLSFDEGAALPAGGVLAIQVVCDEGRVRPAQQVLINGAGGAVGTYAVQVALAMGGDVTAVDRASKLDSLRRLGAGRVVDFETEQVGESSRRYDLIVNIASTGSFSSWRRLLTPDGVYTVLGHDHFGRGTGPVLGSLPRVLGLTARGLVNRNLAGVRGNGSNAERLTQLCDLVADGSVTPLIDSTFALDEVALALAHLATEQSCGRVVVSVQAGRERGRH